MNDKYNFENRLIINYVTTMSSQFNFHMNNFFGERYDGFNQISGSQPITILDCVLNAHLPPRLNL